MFLHCGIGFTVQFSTSDLNFTAMAEIFAGKWKLDRSENFDDYLKELGKFSTFFKFKEEKQRGTK